MHLIRNRVSLFVVDFQQSKQTMLFYVCVYVCVCVMSAVVVPQLHLRRVVQKCRTPRGLGGTETKGRLLS